MAELEVSEISYDPAWGVRPTPGVSPMTTYEMFRQSVAEYPDRTSIVFMDQVFSYREIDDLVAGYATALLKMGIRKGDRVGALLPNCHQHVIAFLATTQIGAIHVPANVMYQGEELAYIFNDAGVKTVITLDLFYANLMEVIDATPIEQVIVTRIDDLLDIEIDLNIRIPYTDRTLAFTDLLGEKAPLPVPAPGFDFDDTMLILYTAGTTGRSKGVMLTHRNFIYNAANQSENFDLNEDDVNMVLFPMFHISGWLLGTICMFYCGGTTILEPRFDPKKYLEIFHKYRVTGFFAPPTVYVAFLNQPEFDTYDLSAFRLSAASGAPVPIQLQKDWEERTGLNLLNGYGLTETTAGAIVGLPNKNKADSIGVPLGGDVKIVDHQGRTVAIGEPGEILFRGPQVAKGYWNNPEETRKAFSDGWFHTGDIATMDARGFVYFVEREKDLIIASAYNISPAEVEGILARHPAVKEAGVIGVPDEYRGETVKAYVVLKDSYKGQTTPEEILEFGKNNMAAYKYPREVEFIDELPKSPIQKILRKELRKLDAQSRKTIEK